VKHDTLLRQDILEELKWDASVRELEIGVAVKDGVATLSGSVDVYAQKCAAEHAVQRVSGVRGVANELEVRLPFDHERSDTDIAHAAVNALTWDDEVPTTVCVTVDQGWVRLIGTVEWQFQKAAAERVVRTLAGVRGVTNLVAILPKDVSPADVTQNIKNALRRTAEADANQIAVETSSGTVTLKGSVRSWTERQDAERAAWSAPGVTHVDDQIAIRM
jgi:osmotically-inducible protein OsmY